MLVRQAIKFPIRKVMAVVISGMILGGIQALLKLFWPEHPFSPFMEDLDLWLQGFIMILAGYFTKEKVNATPTKTVAVEELGNSTPPVVLPAPDGENLGEGKKP